MKTILDRIIEHKATEIKNLKKLGLPHQTEFQQKERSLISKLNTNKNMAIISEFKRASPSKGDINPNLDPVAQAKLYESCGADAISVLTDENFFKGTFADLTAIRSAVDLPLLCKDFIIDQIQIDFAKHAGADIILLIASALETQQLKDLYEYADHIGLEVLIEIHNEQELEKAFVTKAPLIGINNRNLKTFEVSLDRTEQLGPLVKQAGSLLISESGMKAKEDVAKARNAGANGILVGETFMKAAKLQETFNAFRIPIKEGTV
ncbi:indole-3-glycerol phosphate synthase TrpC [Mesobacillus harenae]|uniref:indole-3-glycerol phosphate synthase TrpC n=1 Tax=Mesobacillus harenae TaxID=2213203 RepID=UPI0015808AD3|nr:indole-3-glycerol phosphate synthase TrpC [Mesobacillus harenae]